MGVIRCEVPVSEDEWNSIRLFVTFKAFAGSVPRSAKTKPTMHVRRPVIWIYEPSGRGLSLACQDFSTSGAGYENRPKMAKATTAIRINEAVSPLRNARAWVIMITGSDYYMRVRLLYRSLTPCLDGR